MNMFTKLATRLLATLSIVGLLSTPAAAQGLNTSDMALAFGQAPQTVRSMSALEMHETEGEWLVSLVRAAVKALSKPTPKSAPAPNTGSAGGPGAGKNFSEAQKDANIGQPCTYCGKPTIQSPKPHPDRLHNNQIIPKAQGGNNTNANLNPSCQTCNLQKGTKPLDEFIKSR